MKTALLSLLFALSAPLAFACGTCSTCAGAKPDTAPSTEVAAETTPPALPRHPLKGEIVRVVPERQSLLVKHEEIPGVMRAMTMLLKVEPTALETATPGQAITGLLVRKPDGWWLEAIKPAPTQS